MTERLVTDIFPEADTGTLKFSGIATDSKLQVHGRLFVALDDGHKLVEEAASNGATACLVQQGYSNPYVKIPLIQVSNPLESLQLAARELITETGAKVVGVTGSVGKTMTKEFLHTLLQTKYKTIRTTGNQDCQVELAASLLNSIKGDEEVIVVEMGMTEEGHIQKILEFCPVDIAVVTYIALSHACNFEGLEDIARAKSEIFSGIETKLAIINYDSPYADLLLQKAPGKKISYSTQSLQSDVKLTIEDNFMKVIEFGKKTELPFVAFSAPHVYSNCLAAMLAAKACGMNWDEIARAVKKLVLPKGTLELVEKQGITFINDATCTSEVSSKAALSYIKKKHAHGRKIAVFGQMENLGKYSEECHSRVGKHALQCVERVYCIGKECAPIVAIWQDEDRPVEWFNETDALTATLKRDLRLGDLVLLHNVEPILEAF